MAYDPTKPVWEQTKIDPELREFIVLSPTDVTNLTMEAMKWPDPAAWLSEALNVRGREKRDLIDAHNQARMKEDAARIRDVGHWPRSHLPLKTQPWVTKAEGNQMRFALIHSNNLLEVIEEGKAPVEFESVEEIVKVWSVD